MTTPDVDQIKSAHREMWGRGDYPSLAALVEPLSVDLVEAVGISAGQEVLDVGTGTGNAARNAAAKGARVTGLDLSPVLLEEARRLASEEGVSVEFVEGDAEALPFEDQSFDVVISAIGAMFAPRHEQTAGELARVLRPGGVLGMCNWTPEGVVGEIFKMQSGYMPAPPPFASPPILWGTEDHVRSLFAGTGAEFEFEFARGEVRVVHESVDGWTEYFCDSFGPLVTARAALEPMGKWDEMVGRLKEIYAARNVASDGTLDFPQEYLRVIGRRAG